MLSPGDRVDRYTVVRVIGNGGMASVYQVRHQTLDTPHALKVLHQVSPLLRERLILEGKVQARLVHPNIVAVTDVLEVDGVPGLLMELVQGPTLESWLEQNRPSQAATEQIFRSIVSAVGAAHDLGIVHRDLKPANVLMTPNNLLPVPKVADFGLAKALADPTGSKLTRAGSAMGTPAYMAPEQIRDASDVDGRADIWALGCILYEMTCGRPAFSGGDLLAIFNSVAMGMSLPPRTLTPDIAPSVEAAVLGCLATDRSRRIPDCRTLLAVLDGTTHWVPPATSEGHRFSRASETISADSFGDLELADPSPSLPSTAASQGPTTLAPPDRSVTVPVPARAPTPPASAWKGRTAVAVALLLVGLTAWFFGRRSAVDPALPAEGAIDAAAVESAVAPQAQAISEDPPATALTAATAQPAGPTVAEPPGSNRAEAPSTSPSRSAPPKSSESSGAVVRASGADKVVLSSGGRTRPLGLVPPGTYTIIATFGGSSGSAGTIRVSAGERITLRCDRDFRICSP